MHLELPAIDRDARVACRHGAAEKWGREIQYGLRDHVEGGNILGRQFTIGNDAFAVGTAPIGVAAMLLPLNFVAMTIRSRFAGLQPIWLPIICSEWPLV